MKISNHIYWYKSDASSCNAYLIFEEFGILVDPGTTLHKRFKKIVTEIKKDQLDISQLRQIWLTHDHPDHSQAAKIWAKNLNAKILAHPEAKKILENNNPLVALIEREVKVAGQYHKNLVSSFDISVLMLISNFVYGKWEKTKIEHCFTKNQVINIGNLEIKTIFPSSHSPDDVCFWVPKDKILLSGDLFDTGRGNPFAPVLIFPSADLNQCLRITEKIIALEPRAFCPGHGNLIVGEKRIIDYLEQILKRVQEYKTKTLKHLKQNPKATFYEIGRNLETRKNLSSGVFTAHSTISILGFVVLKSLKEDGLIT